MKVKRCVFHLERYPPLLPGANKVAFAQTPSGRKLMHLEAARGIASVIVAWVYARQNEAGPRQL